MLKNKIRALGLVGLLCALLGAPALSSAGNALSDDTWQINPAMNLSSLFPDADRISLAVAVVPDPLVPRYRRLYDLELVAIELGMLRNGYVLDRFYLPWNDKLRAADDSQHPSGGDTAALPVDRGAYGLLLFRCDSWRHVEDKDQSRADVHANGRRADASTSECNSATDRSPGAAGNGTRFRALYVVTDTSTKGVENRALRCVTDRIASQLPNHTPRRETDCWPWQGKPGASRAEVGLMTYPAKCDKLPPASTLLMLGPTFSGAIDSVGEWSQRLAERPGDLTHFCLVSSSTTDDTNDLVSTRYPRVAYANLAVKNKDKVLHIARLMSALTGTTDYSARPASLQSSRDFQQSQDSRDSKNSNRVAILAEASTFGQGICNERDDPRDEPKGTQLYKQFCKSATFFYFPANIADIRYGLQEQRKEERRDSGLKLPVRSEHLSLELGAENGSEYPESRQSGLTSVSAELAIEQVLDALKAMNPPPRIVIVVATDVRDRLFLFDELRERLPRAMLVDLEADNLLGHPDFLHASRGALAMASVNLTPPVPSDRKPHIPSVQLSMPCQQIQTPDDGPARSRTRPVAAWSSDVQALLARAVKGLMDTPPDERGSPCADVSTTNLIGKAAIQVVTLEGFKPVSRRFVRNDSVSENESTQGKFKLADWISKIDFDVANGGAPALCAAAAWLWMYPLLIAGGGSAQRRSIRVVNSLSYLSYVVCVVYAALLIVVALNIRHEDYDNSVLAWILVALAGGVLGLIFCLFVLRRASQAAPPLTYWNVWVPALLAVASAAMASTPLWWLQSLRSLVRSVGPVVDLDALIRLGLDPDPGLAFLLLVALATFALLYASVVLATAAGVVNRNSTLLRNAQPAANRKAVTINRRGVRNLNPFGLLVIVGLMIAALVGPDLCYTNVRLTIFGLFASMVALLAITATTCSAALLACSAIGAARRITVMSEHILLERGKATGGAGPGVWSHNNSSPRVFPATPVIATVADGGLVARKLRSSSTLTNWTEWLRDWIYNGQDDNNHRVAVFTLLATEISLYQWSVAGAVLCTLASVGAAYLFPIEADRLLLLNLLILAALGVAAGYIATAFERNELLCHVLCNRGPGRHFSAPMFACITVPFLILALAIGIANVPGVVDWGGGLLELLKTLGVHA
jgi:hypothetical protein